MRVDVNVVRKTYMGDKIPRRPRFWITRFARCMPLGFNSITIYNFSIFRHWLLVSIERENQ